MNANRQRRKEKAQKDIETQHCLWARRIQDIMVDNDCDADTALVKLTKEVPKQTAALHPQRRQQMRLAWAAFLRRISNQLTK